MPTNLNSLGQFHRPMSDGMANDILRIPPHQCTTLLLALDSILGIIVFDVLDILTAFIPQQYMSFCMFAWMTANGGSQSRTH